MLLPLEKDYYYFDKLGGDFEAFMSDYDVERRSVLIFGRLLRATAFEGRRTLEVGCGTGRFSSQIIERGAKLTVVDIGRALTGNVCGKLACAGTAADACRLPFASNAFDIVISSECIEHTAAPLLAIEEMCRVCKPGGQVCLTTPNRVWYPLLLASQSLRIRRFSGVEHWLFPGQAARAMRNNAMSDIQMDGCHFWPFQVAFSRPLLRLLDRWGSLLYPLMINFGIRGRKLPS